MNKKVEGHNIKSQMPTFTAQGLKEKIWGLDRFGITNVRIGKFGWIFLLMALAFALAGCGSRNYSWGWYAVSPLTTVGRSNLMFLLVGLWPTIRISIVAFGCSILLGLVIAILGMIPGWTQRFNRIYVEVLRSIPVLVMLLWVYYGLPISMGIDLDVFAAGVVALALCDSAFEAEVFRGGIQSIAKGQVEASTSLGLSRWQTMRFIVLPQAIRRVLPPLGNQFVYMIKMSSLVSIIGFNELTRRANELTVIQYRPLEIYTVLIFEYLLLILLVSYGVRRLERRLDVSRAS